MQSLNEYVCMDCGNTCDCASDLLKHFAQHVQVDDANYFIVESSKQNKKTSIPDLYPISVFKELHCNSNAAIKTDVENEELAPSNYCEITLGETKVTTRIPDSSQNYAQENLTLESDKELRSSVYDKCIKQKQRLTETNGSHQVSIDCDTIKPHLKRKQQKCSIKRKCTKFIVQNGINSLLCST